MEALSPHDERENDTNLPMVAGESAVRMNRVPTCSTGDLTTVTLTQGGQMSLTARKIHPEKVKPWPDELREC